MKKLINDPTTVVTDALAGIEAAHPELRVDHERKVIYRADSPVTGKVVSEAPIPGRWAAPPAPAITTRRPRWRAVRA